MKSHSQRLPLYGGVSLVFQVPFSAGLLAGLLWAQLLLPLLPLLSFLTFLLVGLLLQLLLSSFSFFFFGLNFRPALQLGLFTLGGFSPLGLENGCRVTLFFWTLSSTYKSSESDLGRKLVTIPYGWAVASATRSWQKDLVALG